MVEIYVTVTFGYSVTLHSFATRSNETQTYCLKPIPIGYERNASVGLEPMNFDTKDQRLNHSALVRQNHSLIGCKTI